MSETPDEYHNHEAVDRLHICASMTDELLLEHPAIAAHPEIQARVAKAVELLADAYQMMGLIHHQDPGTVRA